MDSQSPARNHFRFWQVLLLLGVVALVAAVLIFRWANSRDTTLVYSGTVETREIQIGSKIGGRVTSVSVEEGRQVDAGAQLVVFEADELRAQRAQAQATTEQAQADLSRLQQGNRPEEIAQADAAARERAAELQSANNGPRPQELAQAQADFAAAQADAKDAAATYVRMKPLAEKDIISRQQMDGYTAQRDGTAQRAESARQRLALLQAGTRPEDIRATNDRYQQAAEAATLAHRGFRRQDIDAGKARLNQAEAQLQQLDARLREASLTAPAAGVIETVSVRPGDLVPANAIIISMLEPSQIWVKVYVPETELSRIHVGQTASIAVDSVSPEPFSGHIQEIASAAEFLPRNVQTRDDRQHQVFAVKVAIDNPNGIVKSGMSATVRLP